MADTPVDEGYKGGINWAGVRNTPQVLGGLYQQLNHAMLLDDPNTTGQPASGGQTDAPPMSSADKLAHNMPTDTTAQAVLGDPTQPPPDPAMQGIGAEQDALDASEGRIDALGAESKKNKDDSLAALEGIRSEQSNAQDLTVQAAKKRTELMTPLLAQVQTDFKDLNDRAQTAYANTQAATQVQMAKWDDARTQAANSQIQDFFADKTTGGFVVGIISQALGGFANGLAGNPGAPTPLDRVIQRDFERQIQNQNQKGRTAAGEEGKLRVLMSQGLDQLQASAALRAALNDKIKVITDDVANRMGTPDALAKAAQIKADLDTKNQQIQDGVQSNYMTGRIQMEHTRLLVGVSRAKLIATIAKGATLTDPLANDVDGFPGDKVGRSNLAGSIAAFKTASQLSGEENSSYNPIQNTKTRVELQNAITRIMQNGKAGRSFNVKQAEQMTGGFLTDTEGSRKALMRNLKMELQNQMAGGTPKGDLASMFEMQGN
jgi:hypothetical protein